MNLNRLGSGRFTFSYRPLESDRSGSVLGLHVNYLISFSHIKPKIVQMLNLLLYVVLVNMLTFYYRFRFNILSFLAK